MRTPDSNLRNLILNHERALGHDRGFHCPECGCETQNAVGECKSCEGPSDEELEDAGQTRMFT